ncbi:hypothetical protein WN48_05164 [Eufriesea mexicana]|nr:hypothetical protein WN48_05164 [Eufriesea mexicana]
MGGIDEILRWLSHHFSGASDQLDGERRRRFPRSSSVHGPTDFPLELLGNRA